MEQEQKLIFHDIVTEVLNLPKNCVINTYQNRPRPKKNYCTLRYYSHNQEVPSEIRTTKDPGILNVISLGLLTCEVQYFASGETDACNELIKLVNAFDKPSIIAKLDEAKIVVVDSQPIQDISALESKTDINTRASVDITIRFTRYADDDVGYITQVNINGKTNNQDISLNIKT